VAGRIRAGVLVLVIVGCTPAEGRSRAELITPGPWSLPASTRMLGDDQDVTVTEGGPWIGTAGCHGGLTDGAGVMRGYLLEHFPQITSIGGYSCREIVGLPGQMSVHGTGRALDVHIPTIGGDADNDAGDPIANWLVENAEYLGIQRVIWDRTMWSAYPPPYARVEPYDWEGTSPHYDHLHVELSVEASAEGTAFFEGPMDAPVPAGCARLGAAGGVIDDEDPCFTPFGDPRFWRVVDGAGEGGRYLWTNAYSSDAPSNWARWVVRVGAPAEYAVEVSVVAPHNVFAETRYTIAHGASVESIVVDQSAASGWVPLGTFTFDGSARESISVHDNHPGTVASEQHVSVDAVRLIRIGGEMPEEDAGAPDPTDEDAGAVPSGSDAGPAMMDPDAGMSPGDPPAMPPSEGCSVSRAPRTIAWRSIVWSSIAFALGALAIRRRR
jgi:hypothetical protein